MDDKKDHYKIYGWKCNEDNLKTLPPTAPQSAKDLAAWLTLEGRRSSLQEWINCVDDDGRIHGKFWHVGAWTQRMSHSSPNQANIPAVWPDDREPETPVELIKAKYDKQLRALFEADDEAWLVGTDAEGIQLRILCHYMESEEYRDAIVSGDKSLGTDIHSLNKKALGYICKSRDDAKTFIYAWLLGSGLPKTASILQCNIKEAKHAVDTFLASLPELKRVKNVDCVRDHRRGYFIGLDGRRVSVAGQSQHKVLAGYLQNGEAVIMKHANVLWRQKLAKAGIRFEQVDFVHDEWQTVVYGPKSTANWAGRLQVEAIKETGEKFGLFCPLDGKFKVGKNWKETH